MNRNRIISICTLAAVLFTQQLQAKDPTQLIVFGDSLSDPGNYFALYQELEVQPYESTPTGTVFVPSAPYAIGGRHFTNGKTWIEQLAIMLGNPPAGSAAALAPGVFTNYAVGRSRARANPQGVFNQVNLDTQVQAFLDDFAGNAPSEATYVIWIGSNDLADALLTNQPGLANAALGNIQANIQTLYAQGARKFLVVNIPNLGNTPRVRELAVLMQNPAIPFMAGLATSQFNLGLNFVLQGLALNPNFSGLQFQVLDAFTLLENVIAQPAGYGIEVTDRPCVSSDTQGRSQ